MFEHQVSGETVGRLQDWLNTHCPHHLEDTELLPSLVVVVCDVVKQELHEICWMRLRQLREPCRQ